MRSPLSRPFLLVLGLLLLAGPTAHARSNPGDVSGPRAGKWAHEYGALAPDARVIWGRLDNAVRYTPAGGSVIVHLHHTVTDVYITVTDSGPGIPAVETPHIFDRFYRGDRSRARTTGGSGLGLAIARQIVEAHGGRIWVDSPPPGAAHGAEFGFMLPVASATATPC